MSTENSLDPAIRGACAAASIRRSIPLSPGRSGRRPMIRRVWPGSVEPTGGAGGSPTTQFGTTSTRARADSRRPRSRSTSCRLHGEVMAASWRSNLAQRSGTITRPPGRQSCSGHVVHRGARPRGRPGAAGRPSGPGRRRRRASRRKPTSGRKSSTLAQQRVDVEGADKPDSASTSRPGRSPGGCWANMVVAPDVAEPEPAGGRAARPATGRPRGARSGPGRRGPRARRASTACLQPSS